MAALGRTVHPAFSSASDMPVTSFGAAGILMVGPNSAVWQEDGHCEPHIQEEKLV